MASARINKDRKRNWVFVILLLVTGYYFFYYNFVFARTAAIVSVVKKDAYSIFVRYENNSEQRVKVPKIVLPLIKVGDTYFVSIYRNNYRAPFLKSIEPSPK